MYKVTWLCLLLLSLSLQLYSYQKPDARTDTTAAPAEETAGYETAESAPAAKEEVENVKAQLEGLNESYLETKSVVDALRKIKVSGYIQTQYQSAETDGAKSFAGGDFSNTLHNRFAVRRGRVKFNYDNDLTQFVVQFNIGEAGSGALGAKDIYASIREPWLKTFGLTMGLFLRPFGFEIPFSSADLETPERSRFAQILFPGEEDLGAQIEIAPPGGPFSFLNLKAGFFTGNGINAETDNNKDFIGRLGFKFPFEETNLAIDGGLSAYVGAVRVDDGKTTYKINSPSSMQTNAAERNAERKYYGADLQIYYDLPVLGGFVLKGEYITGTNPGTASSNKPYTAGSGDAYLRNISGFYASYVQNLGLYNQFIVRYEAYDPNTDVNGGSVTGASDSKLSSADISYSGLGLGFAHYWDANVKFTLYYDIIYNEKAAPAASGSSLLPFREDLRDNVLTLRMQIRF